MTDNDCPCSPRTCADVGATCGTIDDLCGATLGCGTCGADESCQGGSCIVDTPTGALGDSCVANGDCVSDDCLSEADFAMPGGYCTDACQTSADCGANGYCSASVCYERCVSASDCRPGYACTEQLGSTMACFPEGSGTGPVGAPCASVNDCTGGSLGYCIARGDGWKDGYCSQLCDGTASCPVGTHCAFDDDGTGLCVVNCSSSSTCRGGGFDGYQCYDRDGDSVRECAAAGTGTADVGEPCEGTWECSGGDAAACGTERDGFPDGYCVELCGPNSSCPAGSTCALTLASQYCLDSCAVDAECRSGYLCQSDLFQKVCWPQ